MQTVAHSSVDRRWCDDDPRIRTINLALTFIHVKILYPVQYISHGYSGGQCWFKFEAESSWIKYSKRTDYGQAGWHLRHMHVCGEADNCKICYPRVFTPVVFESKTTYVCCKGSTSYCVNYSTPYSAI